MVFGSSAQTLITDLSSAGLTIGSVYTINSKRGAFQAQDDFFVNPGQTLNTSNLNQQFALISDPTDSTKLYLYSVGLKKFLTSSKTWSHNSPSPIYVFSTGKDYPYALSFSNDYTNNNLMFGGSNQPLLDSWKTLDDGDQFTIAAVEGIEAKLNEARKILETTYYTVTWNIIDQNGNKLATNESEVASGSNATLSLSYPFTTLSPTTEENVNENKTVDVTATFNTPFIASTDDSATYYYWKNANNKYYVYYDASITSYLPMSDSTSNTAAYKWAFYGNPITGYTIKNKAAGDSKYLYIVTASNGVYPTMNDNTKTWPIVSSSNNGISGIDVSKLFSFKLNNVYVNDFKGDHKLSFYQDSPDKDKGSNWIVEVAPTNEPVADYSTLENILMVAKAYPLGDGLSQYSNGDALTTAINSAQKIFDARKTNTDVSNQTQIDNAVDTLNNAIAGLTLNMPKEGTFLKIKNKSTGGYIASPVASSSMSAGRSSDATKLFATRNQTDISSISSSIWYYTTANNANGVLSYYSGAYAISNSNGTGTGKNGMAFICLTNNKTANAGNNYFYDNTTNFPGTYQIMVKNSGWGYFGNEDANYGSIISTATNVDLTNAIYAWVLEEVDSLPIAMHRAVDSIYYATTFLPVNATLPEGTKAYIIEKANNGDTETGTATLTEIANGDNGGVIPANTGVVLLGAKNATEETDTIFLVVGGTASTVEGNLLAGTFTALTPTAKDNITNDYYFGQSSGGAGFYKANLKNVSSTIYINNKAYLPSDNISSLDASNPSKGFTFVFGDDDPTGINSATASDEILQNSVRYNLQGQRVGEGYKGIVIIGGKKYLIK